MQKYDIEIYDTREDKVGTVRNVPAETEQEACEKVAKKKGYLWIGPAHPESGLAGCFAINLQVYRAWNKDKTNKELKAELARDIESVRKGETDEFRGLFWLYEAEDFDDEDFDDLEG
jgi:hypothetical protein